MEYDNNHSTIEPYRIEIWCGLKQKTCIIKRQVIIKEDDLGAQSWGQEALWFELLIEIGTVGIINIYQDTISLYRNTPLSAPHGIDFMKVPLTINEL